MKKPFLYVLLAIAAVSGTGCAALMAPYPGGLYGRHAATRPLPPPAVDPVTSARGRWDNVMRLTPGSIVDVLTQNGLAYVGSFTEANGHSVRVMMEGNEREVARDEVLRIDLVSPPGSDAGAVAKGAVRGAALGVGLVALVSGVIGGEAWPPPAVAWRGGAAIGGVAGGEAALARRQGRIVYIAETQQPVSSRVSYSALEWFRLSDLAVGSRITVVTRTGARHAGRFVAVDDASIRIDIGDGELRIPRDSVERVEIPPNRDPQRRDRRESSPPSGMLEFINPRVPADPTDIMTLPGAVHLVRIGAAPLPVGGAQSPILAMTMRPVAVMPGPGGDPSSGPPLMLPRTGSRAVICQGPPVEIGGRSRSGRRSASR